LARIQGRLGGGFVSRALPDGPPLTSVHSSHATIPVC
jgi:hypothetical protein